MLLSRNLYWLIFGLVPFFLFSGCGDLEPEMQDTRSVVLKMNFNQRSSSRNSQITQADVSNHKTHLIAALPAWEQLSSNYMNYYNSYFSAELMNPAENQVSLEIPLNTQVKIFAFIFSDEYTPDQLLSGVSGVSYYGESPSFSIGTSTNNLSVGITLNSTGTSDISDDEEDTTDTDTTDTDTTAPILAEVTAVTTPTSDTTPDYTFSSDEAGTITYGGSCSSSTTTAVAGNNTITINTLSEGTYSDCTITVTDSNGNVSSSHTITSFTVVITPFIEEVTAVITPTIDNTPNYTFSSTKAGTITYGGSCSSSTTTAVVGNNTITFNALANGTYDDCTIRVTGN